MKQDHDFRFCLCVCAVCNEYSSCYANALFCTVLDILWTPWDVLERSITSFLFICLPGVPPTHQRKTKYLERKKFQCKKRYEKEGDIGRRGGAGRELKILRQIFCFFFRLSLFALLWANVKLCWELAGTAYYKILNLKHLASSVSKCTRSKI